MEKSSEENLLKYAMYTMLYCNDFACNCIKELSPYILEKDKETKKIYGALLKRTNRYLKDIRSIIQESANNFLGDYNSFMDDIVETNFLEFQNCIINAYYKGGITEHEFLGHLEATRSVFYLSISTLECLVDKLNSLGVKSYNLKNYSLKPYSYIMDNLVKWCYRNAEKELNDDFELTKDEEVMKYFKEINNNLLDFESFDKCYKAACELSNEE